MILPPFLSTSAHSTGPYSVLTMLTAPFLPVLDLDVLYVKITYSREVARGLNQHFTKKSQDLQLCCW